MGRPKGQKSFQQKKDPSYQGRRYTMKENYPEETNRKVLAHSIEVSELKTRKIDLNDPDQVRERIREYFELCMTNDMKPTLVELAIALGRDRRSLLEIKNGNTKINDISVGYIESAYDMINGQLEQYMLTQGTNVVAGIFIAKNNFGYKDQVEQVVTHTVDTKKTAEQLAAEAQLLLDD